LSRAKEESKIDLMAPMTVIKSIVPSFRAYRIRHQNVSKT